MYCLFCVILCIVCVNVYCTTATGCQPNCSQQIYHITIISYHNMNNMSTVRNCRLGSVNRLPAVVLYSVGGYSRVKSTKSLSFCMTTFSTSFVSLTVLPQSHDCSCYVSRPILAPPPLWLHKHNDLRAHGFAHSPDMWRHSRLRNYTCAWSWRLCGINLAVCVFLRLMYQCVLRMDCQLLDARSLRKAFSGTHTLHTYVHRHIHTHATTHT